MTPRVADSLSVLPLLGSLRKASYNRMLLNAARGLAPEGITVLDAAEIGTIPLYDDDLRQRDGFTGPVGDLVAGVRAADAVLFVSPEYNYSIPGVLKNAIDWVSRAPEQPFRGKPVGIMGVSTGLFGTARMQYHLRQVLVFVEALPVNRPEILVTQAATRFDAGGNLIDEGTATFVGDYLVMLGEWTRKLAR
jgi:chromate reductase, NAD(P)H dehydrogenase (quinone)